VILPFLLALLVFLTLLGICLPLLRDGRPVAARAAYDQAVYRDQLQELDRDIDRGLVTAPDAEASRLEIQRRLLAADRTQAKQPRLSRSPVLASLVMIFIAGGAIITYLTIGSPTLPDMPFSARPSQQASPQAGQAPRMRAALESLAKRLEENPDDGPSWLLFAQTLSLAGDYDRAEMAYGRAMALGQNGIDVQADHAEMLVLKAGGTVTPAAEVAFRAVLTAAPDNVVALYYLAAARMQVGEPRQAIDGWQHLLAILPSDSPLRPQIGSQIEAAAKAAGIPPPTLAPASTPASAPGAGPNRQSAGTTPAETAQTADMTDVQRESMIRAMVESLAAKQAADPGNFDGWLRLGRAYTVLKDNAKAADAFAKAQALRPDDVAVQEVEAQALMTGYKPGDKVPDRVVALLTQVLAKDPNRPAALWYLGLAAAMNGDASEARNRWTALRKLLPADSEDGKMVDTALSTLPNGRASAQEPAPSSASKQGGN